MEELKKDIDNTLLVCTRIIEPSVIVAALLFIPALFYHILWIPLLSLLLLAAWCYCFFRYDATKECIKYADTNNLTYEQVEAEVDEYLTKKIYERANMP